MIKRNAWAALIVLSVLGSVSATAQVYPSKPVRILVPFPPGGSPDTVARVVGLGLSETLGQPVVVENRPGANGQLAAEAVARAPADGYTLLIADTGHLAINPHLFTKLPYDPVKDFTPIIMAMSTPFFMTVGGKVPAQDLRGLVALSKTRADLRHGSSGNGSTHHLGMALFIKMTGAVLDHIPYKGVAQSVPALLAGEIQVLYTGLPSVQGSVRTGALRILAVGSAKRAPMMPEIPTFAEAGIAGFEIDSRNGFLGPAGMPKAITDRLNKELLTVLNAATTRGRFEAMGILVIGSTPAEYAQMIRDDLQKYAKIVKDSGARID